MNSPFAAAARFKKVEALSIALDESLRLLNIDPGSPEAVSAIERMSEHAWLRAAVRAKCHEPSPTTKGLVLDLYRKRAAGAR